jgi:hypothetical protein
MILIYWMLSEEGFFTNVIQISGCNEPLDGGSALQMEDIKRSTRASVFQSEMVRLTSSDRWQEGRWWREFLVSVLSLRCAAC